MLNLLSIPPLFSQYPPIGGKRKKGSFFGEF